MLLQKLHLQKDSQLLLSYHNHALTAYDFLNYQASYTFYRRIDTEIVVLCCIHILNVFLNKIHFYNFCHNFEDNKSLLQHC